MGANISKPHTKLLAPPPDGLEYLSSLPTEIRLLILGYCSVGSVIKRDHQTRPRCSDRGAAQHPHTSTAHRSILLASKRFYCEGIVLYYNCSLLHIDYYCLQVCFTRRWRISPLLLARRRQIRHVRFVEHVYYAVRRHGAFDGLVLFAPHVDIMSKYISMFPKLELLLIDEMHRKCGPWCGICCKDDRNDDQVSSWRPWLDH